MKDGLRRLGWHRLLLSAAIALGGVILSLFLFGLLRNWEHETAKAQFQASADRRFQAIQSALNDRLTATNTLATYFAGSEVVDRKEFRIFVKPLLEEHPGVLALGWAPHIQASQRLSYEQAVRADGIPRYGITERNAEGQLVPSGQRAEYFPVLFIEPFAKCESLLGFDLASGPPCRDAVQRAEATGRPVAGICTLLKKGTTNRGLLHVLAPTRNDVSNTANRPADQPAADGLVFGLLDVETIVESAIGKLIPVGIDIYVVALSPSDGETVLYTRPSPLRAHEAAEPLERSATKVEFSGEIKVADTRLKIDCVPLKSYFTYRYTWGPAVVLLIGLLVTCLAVGYFFLLTGRTTRVERLVAERTRELQESEQRFRRLVDNAADAFFLHTASGIILDVNNRACESLGFTREELLSMTLADIDIDYVPKQLGRQSDLPPDAYPVSFEGIHRRKDGTTFPVEIRLTSLTANGQRVMLGLARDIGERKRLEQSLRDGERKLHAILDQAFQFIGLMTPDGTLIEANRSALDFRDVSPGDVYNIPFWDTPWWSHSAELQERLRDAVKRAANGEFIRMEVTHLAANGELHWIDFSLKPIMDENGRVIFLLPEGRDITARKQMEERLNKERQLLRDMLDLHEQDRKLVSYEIHDGLAQQLTGALFKFQSIDQLRDRDPDGAREMFDEAIRLLREAMAETRRLIGGLRPPILDDSGVIDAIDYLISERRQRGEPEIEFVHPDDLGRLARPLESSIFRIVQECLTNACRYSQSEKVRVELMKADDHVHIEVRDWGIGFDPTQVEKGHYGLRGIRERARLLEGSVVIESTPGQGTRICVDLPWMRPLENEITKARAEQPIRADGNTA